MNGGANGIARKVRNYGFKFQWERRTRYRALNFWKSGKKSVDGIDCDNFALTIGPAKIFLLVGKMWVELRIDDAKILVSTESNDCDKFLHCWIEPVKILLFTGPVDFGIFLDWVWPGAFVLYK